MTSRTFRGAPPHPKPWPTESKYDLELLRQGDSRNVADRYRYCSNSAIKADLAKSQVSLEIAIENLAHDFNIGSIVRTANAFNVSKVHIVGRRQWNKRGAMVTNRYLEIIHHSTIEDFVTSLKKEQILVAVDNYPGAKNLAKTNLPKSSVLIFGSESDGVSSELAAKAQLSVEIEQLGSTRSINVGAAAAVVMYEWMRQNYW